MPLTDSIEDLIKEVKRLKIKDWEDDDFSDLTVPCNKEDADTFLKHLRARETILKTRGRLSQKISELIAANKKKLSMPPKQQGTGASKSSPTTTSTTNTQRGLLPGTLSATQAGSGSNENSPMKPDSTVAAWFSKAIECLTSAVENGNYQFQWPKDRPVTITKGFDNLEFIRSTLEKGPKSGISEVANIKEKATARKEEEKQSLQLKMIQKEIKQMVSDLHDDRSEHNPGTAEEDVDIRAMLKLISTQLLNYSKNQTFLENWLNHIKQCLDTTKISQPNFECHHSKHPAVDTLKQIETEYCSLTAHARLTQHEKSYLQKQLDEHMQAFDKIDRLLDDDSEEKTSHGNQRRLMPEKDSTRNTSTEETIKSIESKIKSYQQKVCSLQKELADSKHEVDKIKHIHEDDYRDKARQQKQNEQRSGKDQTVTSGIKETGEVIERRSKGLSKFMGADLMLGSPNFADLSDTNRPTRLAERYNELYDEEWTNVYMKLCNNEPPNDTYVVQCLLDILKFAFEYCTDTASKQLAQLEFYSSVPTFSQTKEEKVKWHSEMRVGTVEYGKVAAGKLDAASQQALNDFRQKTVQIAAADLFKHSKTMMRKEKYWNDEYANEECRKYIKSCIEICWLMAIQSPPVHIDFEIPKGNTFDQERFRYYTKKGNKIAFVVWPPLYLAKGGTVLCKGTAQGM